MLITKADIAKHSDFTVNISDTKVDFQIKETGIMEVAPVIGRENYNRIILASTKEELPEKDKALWEHIVVFWALCAYRRIFSIHGVSVTQSGVVVHKEQGDFEPVSDKRRAEILGQIRSRVNFYKSELENHMSTVNYLGSESGCTPKKKRSGFGFRVVSKSKAPVAHRRTVPLETPAETPPPADNEVLPLGPSPIPLP